MDFDSKGLISGTGTGPLLTSNFDADSQVSFSTLDLDLDDYETVSDDIESETTNTISKDASHCIHTLLEAVEFILESGNADVSIADMGFTQLYAEMDRSSLAEKYEMYTKITPHTHEYSETVTAPTCTAQGYTTHVCACGNYYEDSFVPVTAHTYVDGVCSVCGMPDTPFTDLRPHAFYVNAVTWAVNHQPQITKGTTDTTFSPEEPCTRGQVVTFLYRYAGNK